MDGTGSNRTAAARKVPRPYKRRSVSAASDCPAASPDVIVTARSTIESLVLCAPSTRTPRTTYSGPSVTVKLRSDTSVLRRHAGRRVDARIAITTVAVVALESDTCRTLGALRKR